MKPHSLPFPRGRVVRNNPSQLTLDVSNHQREFDFDQASPLESPVSRSKAGTPSNELALHVASFLEANRSVRLDQKTVAELARQFFGTSAGHGRDALDAVEAGFNLYLERIGMDFTDTSASFERLILEGERLPRQYRRDEEQVELQQFSTPHALALLVVTAAALRPKMQVLEPSAGTGNLAVLARLLGATVDTNEIAPKRRELLKLLGFSPTAGLGRRKAR